MPRTVSEIRRIMEAEGTPWTPDLRAAALSGGAIDDAAPDNSHIAPNLMAALMSPPNAALSGATMGLTDKINPVYDVSTGAPWLDTAINKVVTPTARGLGMALPLMLAPQVAVPRALAEGGLLARLAGRALAGAPAFSAYEGGRGAIEGYRGATGDWGTAPDTWDRILGAVGGAESGAVRGAGVGSAMNMLKVPPRLGGDYTGAGLGLGALTAVEGGSPTDIAGSMVAGTAMHTLGSGARTSRAQGIALDGLARAEAAKQRSLTDLLREQYAEQQANEAFLELQSRQFEDLVPAKGEVQKRKTHEKGLARSPAEMAAEAALELADRPEDARTKPNEGPKVPLFQGQERVLRRPGQKAATKENIAPNSQDARSDTPPPEAPVVEPTPKSPVTPEQGAPVAPEKPKRRPGQKKPTEGDVTLGTGAGGLEQIKQAFRRPGQKKALRDETGERAVRAFTAPGFFVDPAKAIDLVVRRPIRGDYRGSKAVDRYRSNEGRLDRMHRGASEVSARAREALAVRSQNVGRVSRILREAGADPKVLTPQDRVALGHALRGTGSPAELSPRAATAFRALDAYRKTPIARARNAGVEVGERENYFHQAQLTPQKLGKPKIRADVIENMMRINPREYPTPEAASKAIDAYVEVVKNKGRGNVQALAKKMVAKGQALSEEHAMVLIDRYSREREVGEFGGFKERQTDMPFYDPDPLRAFAKYIDGAETRIAEAAAFGPKGEKVDELIAEIKDPEVRKAAKFAWEAMRGTAAAEDPTGNMALRRIRRVMGLKLGPFTTMRNLGQPNNILLASDTKSFIEGLRRSRTAYGEKFAQDSGSKSETELRNLKEMQGGFDWWHEATGLLPSERFGRKWAANSGAIFAERRVAQLLKSEPGSRRHNGARRDLEMMDINPDTIIKQGGITHDQLRRAAFQFAHNTYFGYGAKDLPAKFNESEEWKTILQFKAYGAQQGRFLANSTIDELRAGRPGRFARNVAILMTVYPATGEVINDLIAAIQGRDRKNNLFVRYMEDATATGAVGVLMDTIQSARYGSLADFMAGPAFGTLAKMGKISYDAMAGQMTDTQKRFLMMQIPGIGQLFSYRVLPKKEKYSGTSRPGSSPPSKVPPKKVPPKKKVPKRRPIA